MRNPFANIEKRRRWLASLPDGEPCDHPGCLSHVSHPCEGCGRIAGQTLKCEVCGNRATIALRDFIERANYRMGYMQHEPDGDPHYFCEEHKRESQVRPGTPIGEGSHFLDSVLPAARDEVDWDAAEAWIEERAESEDELVFIDKRERDEIEGPKDDT